MTPKIRVPAFDMDFRDWVTAEVAFSVDEDYRAFAEKVIEEKWVGSTTRSLQMHLRCREYYGPDAAIFAHLRDVWEKWLRLRETMLNDQYVYDP